MKKTSDFGYNLSSLSRRKQERQKHSNLKEQNQTKNIIMRLPCDIFSENIALYLVSFLSISCK